MQAASDFEKGCPEISFYAISAIAVSIVAISTAHNFNPLQFRPKEMLTNYS